MLQALSDLEIDVTGRLRSDPLVADLTELVEDLRRFLVEVEREQAHLDPQDLKDICADASARIGLMVQQHQPTLYEHRACRRRLGRWYRLYTRVCLLPLGVN
jgi:hypothetical protein